MRSGSLLILLVVALLGAASPAWGHPEPNDVDGDDVLNQLDNCPNDYNVGQDDFDRDGIGDRCDPNYDGDGDTIVPEYRYVGGPVADNCPGFPNTDQADADGDGVGDVCDFDTDLDGTADVFDNCPRVHNFGQTDQDKDRLGDVCDTDIDADRILNGPDNCDDVYNPDQRDADGDGRGFICDADDTPPPPAPGPGGTSPGADPSDRTAPTVRILGLKRSYRRAALRRRLPIRVRCSEACAITARLTAARRTIARATATLGGAGRTYVFLRAKRKAIRSLARRARVRAKLRLAVVDRSGNVRRMTRRVTLRR